MSKKVTITISSCIECQHCFKERDYTADSFETCFRFYCKKINKNIKRYVDWYEKEQEIPSWCPL